MVLARGSSKSSDWWILMEISIWAWLCTEIQERDFGMGFGKDLGKVEIMAAKLSDCIM